MKTGAAYQEIQGKNPQTLAYGLTDSRQGSRVDRREVLPLDRQQRVAGRCGDARADPHQPHRLLGDGNDQLVDASLLRVATRPELRTERRLRIGPHGRGRVPQGDVPHPAGVRRVAVQPRALHPLRSGRSLRRARRTGSARARHPRILRGAAMTHDLVIKGGRSSTAPARRRAPPTSRSPTASSPRSARSTAPRTTIDADGALVTPGFVDVHTHFDGQVTWDPLLTPSCWHGVTTVVMGYCGVGFAPVQPDKHDWLIGLMEGVEDIPGAALSEGIEWSGRTSPSTSTRSTALEDARRRRAGPHGAVRAYVMGERGAKNEPATAADIDAMARIVRAGIEAGALGFSTSRTIAHMAIDGEPVPGTFAAEDELFGIGAASVTSAPACSSSRPRVRSARISPPPTRVAWMRSSPARSTTGIVRAHPERPRPRSWRRMLELCSAAAAEGAPVRPQVAGRPSACCSGCRRSIRSRTARRGAAQRHVDRRAGRGDARPRLREKLLAEVDDAITPLREFLDPERSFPMVAARLRARAPDSIAGRAAAAASRSWTSTTTRCWTTTASRSCCVRCSTSATSPSTRRRDAAASHHAWGLGDGGAHCGTTCDASTPTFMLTHWARDRGHDRLPLEWVVRKMRRRRRRCTASAIAARSPREDRRRQRDRLRHLRLDRPVMVHDLPGDARRFVQRAHGYVTTVKSGEVVLCDGDDQGVRPGQLLRGAR